MTRRSIILVVCGALTVVVGIAVALIGGSDRSGSGSSGATPVLVATAPVAVGAEGSDVVAQGVVVVEQVPTDDRQAGALTDAGQLDGRTFAVAVADGAQVRASDLVPQGGASGPVDVPEGTEAVAVDVPFVPGAAGFAQPGDRVNVFALLDDASPATAGDPAGPGGPATVGVLSDVRVLSVSTASGSTTATSSASSGTTATASPKQITYLLAVPVDRVPSLVQAAGFHRLWVSIPAEGASPRPAASAGDASLEVGR